MYPFITIWWRHIEMTGLWFILWLLTFCIVCYLRTKKTNLIFTDMFYSLPTMIAIIYFFGAYSYFVFNHGYLIPHTIVELSTIIIPPNYSFHASGLALGIVVSIILFLYQNPSSIIQKKWIDSLFISYMSWIIVFWVLLVLGDDMIGISTTNFLWIYAMTPFSEVAKFNQVYPVWLFLSAAAGLSFVVSKFIFKRWTPWWQWIGWFWLFFLLLGIVLIFQNYSRHAVISLWWLSIDINQYIIRTLSIFCRFWYILIHKKRKSIIRIGI